MLRMGKKAQDRALASVEASWTGSEWRLWAVGDGWVGGR